MPRPVYIIAAESVSEDARTNALSIFQILERVEMKPAPTGGQAVTPNASVEPHNALIRMYVLAVWMKLPEDDPEQLYQHQIAICTPDGNERIVVDDPEVRFTDDDRPLNRYAMIINGMPSTGPGILRFESRMRKVGHDGDDWIKQDYPMLFVAKQAPAQATQTPQS